MLSEADYEEFDSQSFREALADKANWPGEDNVWVESPGQPPF